MVKQTSATNEYRNPDHEIYADSARLQKQISRLNSVQIEHLRGQILNFVESAPRNTQASYNALYGELGLFSSRGDEKGSAIHQGFHKRDYGYNTHGRDVNPNFNDAKKFGHEVLALLNKAEAKLAGRGVNIESMEPENQKAIDQISLELKTLSNDKLLDMKTRLGDLVQNMHGDSVVHPLDKTSYGKDLMRKTMNSLPDAKDSPNSPSRTIIGAMLTKAPADTDGITNRQDLLHATLAKVNDTLKESGMASAREKHRPANYASHTSPAHTQNPQGVAAAKALLNGAGSPQHLQFFQKHLGIATNNSDAERLTHFALEAYVNNGGDMAAAKTRMLAHAEIGGVSNGEIAALALSPTQIHNVIASAGKNNSSAKA